MMSNEAVVVFIVLFLVVAFTLYVVIRTIMAHDDAIEAIGDSLRGAREDVRKAYMTAITTKDKTEDARKTLEGRITAINNMVAQLHARATYSPERGGYNDEEGGQVVAEVRVHTEKAASANKWALVKTEEGESVAHFNSKFFTMVANTDIYHLDDVEFIIKAVKRK